MKVNVSPKHPRFIKDRDKFRDWYLDEPVRIEILLVTGETIIIEVDKGFRFDQHTVPSILTLIFPRHNELDGTAALVHDVLIEFESMLRLTREEQDIAYTTVMRNPAYVSSELRSKWMPVGVMAYGKAKYIFRKDDRGPKKKLTFLKVTLTHVDK